jgi:hypothetical protein
MSEAMAGMAWSEIAKSAYLAYSASTDNKNFRGEEMPKFEDLPVKIQTAWECAVRQAADCSFLTGEVKAGALNEYRWKNWTDMRLSKSEGQKIEI